MSLGLAVKPSNLSWIFLILFFDRLELVLDGAELVIAAVSASRIAHISA